MNRREKSEKILFYRREHKIFVKNKKRKKKKKNLKRKRTKLVAFLKRKGFVKRCQCRQNRKNKIEIPKDFSLIQNPDESIEVLRKLFYLGINSKSNKLYIEHDRVKNLDICASTIMDVLIMEIEKIKKNQKQDFSILGHVKCEKKIMDILEVSGILKHLGIIDCDYKPDYIQKLELIECGAPDVVSTKVTDYINLCLNEQGFEFTREGKFNFSEMIGEVIDNCKLHGGRFSKWYTLGHFTMEDDIGECQLVVFNFGESIYDNLKNGETSSETRKSLEKITQYYKNKFSRQSWNEEALWTLYSLQDGVSRLRDIKNPDRGTGTATFIDLFQKIGNTIDNNTPLMSVTSGKVSILFNDKYRIRNSNFDGEERKIIAFNKENDLYKLPDKRNIRILKNKFPGTVISMKFYLDKKYLVKIMEEDENERNQSYSM